jgi:superfamily II DNA or RNA helicase
LTAPTLRPYQIDCHDKVFNAWDAGLDRVAISAATGAGKSVILAAIARSFIRLYGGPVVLLAHRRELIKQAAKHFQKAGPDLKVETVLGNPGPMNSTKRARTVHEWKCADVLVSTVQTLASASTMKVFPNPSLIIVDEAHRSPANQYKKVLTALGAFSGTKTLGVTATPFREDHREFSDIFQAVVANIDIGWLITHCDDGNGGVIECDPGNGYLIPPTLRHLLVDGLDLSVVPTSRMNGTVDFREAELAAAMEASGAFDMVIDVIAKEFPDRKGAIFAPTVESSKYLAERMTERGLPCHHIDGTMDTKPRERILGDFGSNTVRWLSNVNIITEGFDVPDIDMVVLAKPTRSRIFFRQSVGRALRPAPGKYDAIVLDVAGASDGMSLAGLEALTDTEVLTAGDGETLTDLLERTDRERRGRYNRIQSHASKAQDIQNRAERTLEQVKLTAEGAKDKLPGLFAFVDTVTPRHHTVLDHTTAAIDRFIETKPTMTLKELADAEDFIAEKAGLASKALSEVDSVKSVMRHALMQLKEDPVSEVSQAIITGEIKTVKGNLFGEEEERYKPGMPGDVQGLKLRKTSKERKPVHDGRYGWAMKSSNGHLFVPVHGINQETGKQERDPVKLVVAVRTGDVYTPVIWDATTQKVDEIATQMSLDDAYQLIVERALEDTVAENLINPNAAWRKKPSSDKATAFATRIAPHTEIPDNATAGFTGDVVLFAKHNRIVNALGTWVAEQLAQRTPELVC